MASVGLRELRQHASDLLRRVEAGEEITVTVSGRPSAVLRPVTRARWVTWDDLAEVFDGDDDPGWSRDRDLLNDEIRDPWAAR